MATSTKSRIAGRGAKRRKGAVADPRLGTEIPAQLGTLLQRMYGDLLQEPIPERFVGILKAYRPPGPEGRS